MEVKDSFEPFLGYLKSRTKKLYLRRGFIWPFNFDDPNGDLPWQGGVKKDGTFTVLRRGYGKLSSYWISGKVYSRDSVTFIEVVIVRPIMPIILKIAGVLLFGLLIARTNEWESSVLEAPMWFWVLVVCIFLANFFRGRNEFSNTLRDFREFVNQYNRSIELIEKDKQYRKERWGSSQ